MSKLWGLARSLLIYHNPMITGPWRRFYAEVLKPGDLVFDVGAHVGSRARAMRHAGARVVALEPQKLFARYLRWTLPKDIVLIEAAAGAAESTARMAVSSRHPTVSSLQTAFVDGAATAPGFEHVRWDKTEEVAVVTLDSLIKAHGVPKYVKIDVEGFELEVLAGLSQPVRMISVEYLPGFPQMTCRTLDRLAELGDYRFKPLVGEGAQFLWPDWRPAEDVRDWLAGLAPDATSGDLFAKLHQG